MMYLIGANMDLDPVNTWLGGVNTTMKWAIALGIFLVWVTYKLNQR